MQFKSYLLDSRHFRLNNIEVDLGVSLSTSGICRIASLTFAETPLLHATASLHRPRLFKTNLVTLDFILAKFQNKHFKMALTFFSFLNFPFFPNLALVERLKNLKGTHSLIFLFQVDAFVDIKRPFIKNLWGVQISYTFRFVSFCFLMLLLKETLIDPFLYGAVCLNVYVVKRVWDLIDPEPSSWKQFSKHLWKKL